MLEKHRFINGLGRIVIMKTKKKEKYVPMTPEMKLISRQMFGYDDRAYADILEDDD